MNRVLCSALLVLAVAGSAAETETTPDLTAANERAQQVISKLDTTSLTPDVQVEAEELIAEYRKVFRDSSESEAAAVAEVQIHKLKEAMRDAGPDNWLEAIRKNAAAFQEVKQHVDKDGNPEFQEISLNRHAHYAGGQSFDGFKFVATSENGFVWGFLTNPKIGEWGILDVSGEPVRFEYFHFQYRSGWQIHPETNDRTDKIVLQTIPNGLKKQHAYIIWFQMATDDEIKLRVVYDFNRAPENGMKIAMALQFKSKYESTKAAAEAGDKEAQYRLGFMYQHWNAAPMDVPLAVKWYKKAAEQGYPDAANQIGNIYLTGMGGMKPDASEGMKFYIRGAEIGSDDAMNNLGDVYFYGWGIKPNTEHAMKWYSKATELGNVLAEGKLGYLYRKSKDIPEAIQKAFSHYQHAALAGDASAATNLGICYYKGEGTAINDLQAFRWLVRGNWEKCESAPYYLGSLYFEGRGVDRNLKKAFKIFREGIAKKEPWCNFKAGQMLYDGEGVKQDYGEALRCLKYAGQHKVAAAAFLVGVAYENGRGVEKDMVEANKWYKTAADLGDENGRQKLIKHEPAAGNNDF
jgi:TPR repeat protein